MGLLSRLRAFFHRKKDDAPKPPLLGIALGSGGAKGMAHLGALKAFEEEGITFSFVTGASIGSIVGALYAKGYSAADMVRIIESLNRREFSMRLRPFADMEFVERFLETYLDGDFSTLRLPFAAWVTDGERNEGFSLGYGKLARVCTASSAIPPFFRGVEIGGRRLYDGAFTNAVPADACRQLGAEVVIGIDLAAYARPDTERGRVARLFGTAYQKMLPVRYTEDCRTRGYRHADIMLRPALGEYTALDVSRTAMDRMFELGYEEAKARMEEIRAIIARESK